MCSKCKSVVDLHRNTFLFINNSDSFTYLTVHSMSKTKISTFIRMLALFFFIVFCYRVVCETCEIEQWPTKNITKYSFKNKNNQIIIFLWNEYRPKSAETLVIFHCCYLFYTFPSWNLFFSLSLSFTSNEFPMPIAFSVSAFCISVHEKRLNSFSSYLKLVDKR